jgi:hypothetical protein
MRASRAVVETHMCVSRTSGVVALAGMLRLTPRATAVVALAHTLAVKELDLGDEAVGEGGVQARRRKTIPPEQLQARRSATSLPRPERQPPLAVGRSHPLRRHAKTLRQLLFCVGKQIRGSDL